MSSECSSDGHLDFSGDSDCSWDSVEEDSESDYSDENESPAPTPKQ